MMHQLLLWLGLVDADVIRWHEVYVLWPHRDVRGELVGPGCVSRRRFEGRWQYRDDAPDDRDWFAEW